MTDELLKALQLIKEECNKHCPNCDKCPMCDASNNCGVSDSGSPKFWSLEKKEVYF